MPEITIHETESPAGERVRTRLSYEEGRLAVAVGEKVMALPDGSLDAVMKRFGKPLAVEEREMMVDERLDLGDGRSLVRFRFLARYDVIARDFLVLYAPDAEPLCELATSVTAALDHLARRFSQAGDAVDFP